MQAKAETDADSSTSAAAAAENPRQALTNGSPGGTDKTGGHHARVLNQHPCYSFWIQRFSVVVNFVLQHG